MPLDLLCATREHNASGEEVEEQWNRKTVSTQTYWRWKWLNCREQDLNERVNPTVLVTQHSLIYILMEISKVTRLRARRPELDSRQELGFYSFHRVHTCSGAHPASYVMGTAGSFSGVKQPWREDYHSPPSSFQVKNAWSYHFIPPYVFMAWCLVKQRTVLPNDRDASAAIHISVARPTLIHPSSIFSMALCEQNPEWDRQLQHPNFMQHGLSWEADKRSDAQEIARQFM
jgi:hypothetical protein